MIRRLKYIVICSVAALFLAGCKDKVVLPEQYAVGEDTLPAIKVVSECVEFSEETNSETEQPFYTYSKPTDDKQVLQEYVEMLQNEYNCSVIDEKGIIQKKAPDFSQDTGTIHLGTASTTGKGSFVLDIEWNGNSCMISPAYRPTLQIKEAPKPKSKTLEEIVQVLEHSTPQDLGLEGKSMTEYSVIPEDGQVFIDGLPAVLLNVYCKKSDKYEGSYIVSPRNKKVYSLKNDTKAAVPLSVQWR